MNLVFSLLGGIGVAMIAIFIIIYCFWLYRLVDLLVTKTKIVDMRLKDLLEEVREMKGWEE